MKTNQYINKNYRIQIVDPEIPFLFCLPSSKQSHSESEIPKNSIVKIVDFHLLNGINWFEVEYNEKLYLVTESQIKDFFIPIHIKK